MAFLYAYGIVRIYLKWPVCKNERRVGAACGFKNVQVPLSFAVTVVIKYKYIRIQADGDLFQSHNVRR
jgi:hypothetical protein